MNMTTFSGPAGVATYRAAALTSGLSLYAKTGMRPNRAWTPSAMLKAAGGITGRTYRRGEYTLAVADLTAWLDANGTTGEA